MSHAVIPLDAVCSFPPLLGLKFCEWEGFGVSVSSSILSLSSLGHSTVVSGSSQPETHMPIWESWALFQGFALVDRRLCAGCLGQVPETQKPTGSFLVPPSFCLLWRDQCFLLFLLSLYPSSCLVEANFLPPKFLSLASFQVLFLSFLISLFCLTYFVEIFCLLLLLVIRVFFDSWCVGACFLFWGVQRDLSAIFQAWHALGLLRVWG